MSSQQLESGWSAANVVPQALLHARRSTLAVSLARQAADLLAHVRRVIERSSHPELVERVDQRIPAGTAAGWHLLPALSAAMAMAVAARADDSAADAERAMRR
ncbi:hypothetical protein [Actinomadura sp. 7K534]|uniref:hypothetical protein n=1 Tax=Actinomadura sp. 7K534 TaxID=2530366 RepID=UPI00104C77C3|nr:hypothetical protein [Actinomadura sp. 7K534]TDB88713.1 hypothetical protein E1266_30875 [Actinomadura sp. 7K534]